MDDIKRSDPSFYDFKISQRIFQGGDYPAKGLKGIAGAGAIQGLGKNLATQSLSDSFQAVGGLKMVGQPNDPASETARNTVEEFIQFVVRPGL